jgi:hypothetical protein
MTTQSAEKYISNIEKNVAKDVFMSKPMSDFDLAKRAIVSNVSEIVRQLDHDDLESLAKVQREVEELKAKYLNAKAAMQLKVVQTIGSWTNR